MKLFRGRNKSAEMGNKNPNDFDGKSADDWNNIKKEVPFSGDLENRRRENEARQQRKVVASILYDKQYIRYHDVELPEGAEEEFTRKINSGEISKGQQKDFLQTIADPVTIDGAEVVSEKFGNDKHAWKILGFALAGPNGFDKYGDIMGPDAISAFIKRYPTPLDFDDTNVALLNAIGRVNSDQKTREYEEDLKQFRRKIYGKKQEYYERIQELKEKGVAEYQEDLSFSIEHYSNDEGEKILSKSIIDGDPFRCQGEFYSLNPRILKGNGLSPKYKVTLEGVEIGLSDRYKVSGRDAVVGYVKVGDSYKVRSFYKSNSQGGWRYLPEYVSNFDDSGTIVHFGKGYTEEMTTLPCEMQAALSRVAQGEMAKLTTMPEFIFAGAAKSYDSKSSCYAAKVRKELRGDIYEEVDLEPVVDFGKLSNHKGDPEGIMVREAMSPDFAKELLSWDSMTGMYGHLKNRVYKSRDGRLKYTFSEDDEGRAFVSSIETNSKITSAGIREEWVSGGDVETPLYEYASQDGGYGSEGDRVGNYVCMWNNYLSKMQIIQDYLRARRK